MSQFQRLSRLVWASMFAAISIAVAGSSSVGVARAVTIECAPPTSPIAGTVATPAVEQVADIAFPEGGGELTVFAAASLTASFSAIGESLEADNPGLAVTFNFAGSPALVTQLSEGASADVFASASVAQMDAAISAGVIIGGPAVFASNQLVIVVPNDNPAGLQSPRDLANEGVKLVVAQPEVPAGQYARQVICQAAADRGTYGEDFVADVGENVVSEEDNVKAVLAKVQLGEADAGIVYTTDVTADVAEDVTLIGIPAAINVTASYPIAPVAGGNTEMAAAFIGYLLTPAGQAMLQSYGFEPAP